MAVNDVYRVAAQYNGVNGDSINVYHWRMIIEGGGGEQDVLEDIDARLGGLYSAVNDQISDSQTPIGAEVDNITQGTKVGFTNDWAVALGSGGANDDVLPVQSTALVLGLTPVLRVQGRKYLPPFTESATVGGVWTAAIIADLDAYADLYTQPFVSGNNNTYDAGVQQRSNGALGDFIVFTGKKLIINPRTQRRRYFRVGS